MSIRDNVLRLMQTVENKKAQLGLKYDIHIVAVTKTRTPEEIREAAQAGIKTIGENRVQEAEKKFQQIAELKLNKHMVGNLQENKANKAAIIFDAIQSLDSLKVAERLNRKLSQLNKMMPVLIEVKTSPEPTKSGILPEEAEEFIDGLMNYRQLVLQGLMTVAPFVNDEAMIRNSFRMLYRLRERLTQVYSSVDLSVLSMGMSNDFIIALEEGATMIRPGQLIFGNRQYDDNLSK